LKDVEKNTPFEYKVDNWEECLNAYCRDPVKELEALERRANVFKNFRKEDWHEKKKEKFTNCFGLEMEREIDEKKTKDDGEPDGV
jgi:hypothetical protein